MRKLLLLSASVLMCGVLAFADDTEKKPDKKEDKTKSEPVLTPTGLMLSRKPDTKLFPYGADSTQMSFQLHYPGKALLSIDTSSKLESVKDDKGNSLIDEKGIFKPNWGGYNQVSGDRTGMIVSFYAPGRLPGKGASKVLVKGEIVVVCGTDEKSEELKKIEFKAKEEATFGDFTLKVTAEKAPFGGQGPQFELTSKIGAIKSVVVKDADDKAVQVQQGFGGGFPVAGKFTFRYSLQKALKEGKVIVTYYSKSEKVKVPVDLSVGINLLKD